MIQRAFILTLIEECENYDSLASQKQFDRIRYAARQWTGSVGVLLALICKLCHRQNWEDAKAHDLPPLAAKCGLDEEWVRTVMALTKD